MARMTIRDIARLAGVSVTTVSRALNNAPEINSQTRERVLQVCREQGYRSNLLARSLVSSRTRVLGVILPELSGPFHASIVLHLERYAQEQDYQIMLCCGRVGGSETAALFDFLVSHRVDGILLVSASSAAPICCGATHGGRPPCCWGMCPRPPRFSGSTLSAPTTM